jgi:PAS domain S-box-containing protein
VLKTIKTRIPALSLRKRAEAALGARNKDLQRLSGEEVEKLVHELLVHQIELEMQNEELRKSQVELADSRDCFNDLYDFAPVGYVTLDRGAKIVQANLTAASMLGVRRTQLLGRKFTGFVAPESQDTFYLHQRAAVESEVKEASELLLQRVDGVKMFVQFETVRTKNPSTDTLRLRSTMCDISTLKQAVEALRKSHCELEERVRARTAELSQANETLRLSEARKAAVLNASLEAIITIDQNGKILDFNRTAETIFGYQCNEVLGKEMLKLIGPAAFQSTPWRDLEQSLATDHSPTVDGRIEVSAKRRDGSEFPVEIEIARIAAAQPPIFICFMRDITARIGIRAEAEARARQEAAVTALSREALAGRNIGWLCSEAVWTLARVLDVEFSKILELASAGEELILRAGVGWSEGRVGMRRLPARGDSQASYTLQQSEPVLVDDITKETRFRASALLLDHSVVSGMSAVIRGRSRPYGVLSVHTARKRCFNNHEAYFLQSIADVLADAIMRRQLEEKLLEISDREQLRIGQDLHDGLCQKLAGIEFRTVVLADKLAGGPGAREEAQNIGALLRDSIQDARILSRGLAPVDLETNGLMCALSRLATSCRKLYEIDCQFDCERPVLIEDQETSTHLYRIAQEAIGNAIRHGHAKSIVVSLRRAGAETLLTITNDGLPLPGNPERRGGMGLQIMRCRADMIGATFRIESTGDGKTAVICSFKHGGG